MESRIRLRNLTRDFDAGGSTIRAVDGIDLDIGAGEIVALLGPNGAGKTTTLDMILRFAEPTSRRVEVFGRRPRAAVTAGWVSRRPWPRHTLAPASRRP